MKKFTNYLKTVALVTALFAATIAKAQCIANFTWAPGANGVMNFTSTSTPTTAMTNYFWSFGNGTQSNVAAPNNTATTTYPGNGVYSVLLFYSTGSCSTSVTYTFMVTNVTTPTCNLSPNFSSNNGANGLVSFGNTSTGTVSGTTYVWNFGDGSPASTANAPTHVYTTNGTYVVTLNADNNFTSPTCTNSHTANVVVTNANPPTPTCNVNANFSFTQSGGVVNFSNLSTGTVAGASYVWKFGDGSPISFANSPVHTYTSNGTYTVQLAVNSPSTSPFCNDSTFQVINVTTSTCNANAGFSLVPSGTPQYWFAIPASTMNVSNAVWSWGDGSTSTGIFSSHTYSAAGFYGICLSVTTTCGATSVNCFTYNVNKSSEDNAVVRVDVKTAEQIAAGIEDSYGDNVAYSISPNPNNGTFKLDIGGLTANNVSINVYSILGALVYESESEIWTGSLTKEINLNSAPQGVYFIKVSSNNKTYTKKLIINK